MLFSFAITALIFVGLGFIASKVLKKLRGISEKKIYTQPYECGEAPHLPTRTPYKVLFFISAIVFLIFEIEALLLFPWAVSLRKIPAKERLMSLFEGAGFVFLLVVPIFFLWKWKLLGWPRPKNLQKPADTFSNKIPLTLYEKFNQNPWYENRHR